MANHDPQWLSNLFLGLSVCCRISTQRGVSQIAAGSCPSINGELWRGWVALEKYCVMSRATDSKRWPSWDCANPVLFWRVQCSLRILPSNSNKSLSGHGIIFLSFDSSSTRYIRFLGGSILLRRLLLPRLLLVLVLSISECCCVSINWHWPDGGCLRDLQELFQLAFITDRVKISFNGFGRKTTGGGTTKRFIWNIFSLPASIVDCTFASTAELNYKIDYYQHTKIAILIAVVDQTQEMKHENQSEIFTWVETGWKNGKREQGQSQKRDLLCLLFLYVEIYACLIIGGVYKAPRSWYFRWNVF